MPTRSAKAKPLFLSLALLVTIFLPAPITPQVPRQGSPHSESPSKSPINILIADAKAADTEEGDRRYSKHLTEWFVAKQVGDAYLTSFSRRLATADLMARHGKRKLIPESVVAQAFNGLMKQVTDPSSKLLQTDTNVVHQLRLAVSEVSPALSTVKSNSSECLPAEAVFLMIQLRFHNGSTEDPCPPTPDVNGHLVQHACGEAADVLVASYSRSHSRSKNVALFEKVAQLFDM